MPYLFVLLFSLFQPSAPAPADALRPGNAVLDSARLTAGADSLALVVVHNGEAGIAGLMTLQTVHRADEMIRTETLFDPNGTVLHQDSFAVAAATLAPRYRVAAEGLRTFEEGAFYANSLDLVLGALRTGVNVFQPRAMIRPGRFARAGAGTGKLTMTTSDGETPAFACW